MSKGLSLHVGLNNVDKSHYGDIPVLKAAVNDAVFWQGFAEQEGYKTKNLSDQGATSAEVIGCLKEYAQQLEPGDIMMLTYAGHGASIANDKPSKLDNERYDQTWCLYDRQLLDDELYESFEAFKEGVRIIVVSDSCHSRTITRDAGVDLNELLSNGIARSAKVRGFRSRKLTKMEEKLIDLNHGETIYKPLQKKYNSKPQGQGVKASVKLLAACQDDEETLDGENNGIFTEAFVDLFKNPAFKNANCEMLIAAVRDCYFFPKPDFFQYGGIIPAFDYGFPFKINIDNASKVTGYRKPDLTFSEPRSVGNSSGAGDAGIVETFKPAILLIETESIDIDAPIGGKDVTILENITRGSLRQITIQLPEISHQFGWSAAHALQTQLKVKGIIATVEPVLTINPAQKERLTREGDINNPDYIKEWPPSLQQGTVGIGWHLDKDHSQLALAAEKVSKKAGARVRIGHIDTGYREKHIALPSGLNEALAHSFIKKENPNQAIDAPGSGGQEGHGLGTMVLLAGNKVAKSDTFNEFDGFIGGIPFAEIIPMRVSESVAIFNDSNFCDAIEYAIENKCEVISMSMAGKPSKRMARAVNNAYEAGIVLVTAASNCWYKGIMAALPKCVLYPAAFERVIAATGAMYDHKPYDVNFIQQSRFAIGTKYMQGCWGPESRMKKALAAYTPNTPWASHPMTFLRSGGGTSSATPQVAAAAAIWIAYYRDELEAKGYYKPKHQWKKVEAVRKALFKSAAKEKVFGEWKKYYGNGIIRALDALEIGVAEESELRPSPDAESSWFGAVELISSFFLRRKLFRSVSEKPESESLANELLQLLQMDPQFYDLFSTLDLTNPAELETLMNDKEFQQKILKSPYASNYLKEAIIE